MTKLLIVGAGPAGNFAAYLLAKQGMDVLVPEEHKKIGEPVACTGVITGDVLAKILQLPEKLIVNRIKNARIISPDGQSVNVKLKNDIIIDRAEFDRHLAGMAKASGAKYLLGHRFESLQRKGKKIIASARFGNTTKILETDYIIGADGPASPVSKSAGLFGKRQFYIGIQATMKLENDNSIQFFPSNRGIAWVVPENRKIARVGIAAKRNAAEYFKQFGESAAGQGFEKKIISRQAGPIPVYNPQAKTQTKDSKILLVGDAATTVKATTLGGVNQGLIGAGCAARAIIEGKNYTKLWKKAMGTNLHLSLIMRQTMDNFSDEDYNKLIQTFQQPKNREILEKYDRDEPSKFALKLLLQEPKLLLLARKLFF